MYTLYILFYMNTAVINIRTDAQIKRQAQKVANEMGISLSSLINGLLKHVVKTKKVVLSAKEEPNRYLVQSLIRSKQDLKEGRFVSFSSGRAAVDYLDKMIQHEKRRRTS